MWGYFNLLEEFTFFICKWPKAAPNATPKPIPKTPLSKRISKDLKSVKIWKLINTGRKIMAAIIFFTKLMSIDLNFSV